MPALPSPEQLAWLYVKPTSELNAGEASAVARVRQDDEAARVLALSQELGRLVRRRCLTPGALERLCASIDPRRRWCGVIDDFQRRSGYSE